MEKKRYLIEVGTGLDLHGGDVTKAALRAIEDAMHHCCMAGVREIHNAGPQNLALRVKICCPRPEELDIAALKQPVHFYQDVEIIPAEGGASEQGLYVPEMGDGETIVVAVAVITVYLKA